MEKDNENNEWIYNTPPKPKEKRECPDAPKKKKRELRMIPFILDYNVDESSPCKEKF